MLERVRVTSLTDCYSFLARDSFVSTRGARGFVRKVFNQEETKFSDKKPYLGTRNTEQIAIPTLIFGNNRAAQSRQEHVTRHVLKSPENIDATYRVSRNSCTHNKAQFSLTTFREKNRSN